MGDVQSCVVCTDGAADVNIKRWGIGLTFSCHADTLGLDGTPRYYAEHSLSGWDCDSTYIDENGQRGPIIILQNDIALIETIALARAFCCVASYVPTHIMPIIISDRVASLRNLENLNGRPTRAKRQAMAYALRLLRSEVVNALRVHDTIRVFFHGDRGLNSQWRPDHLSRMGTNSDRLPEDPDDLYSVRINFNAENVIRRVNEDGMILEQVLRLE